MHKTNTSKDSRRWVTKREITMKGSWGHLIDEVGASQDRIIPKIFRNIHLLYESTCDIKDMCVFLFSNAILL